MDTALDTVAGLLFAGALAMIVFSQRELRAARNLLLLVAAVLCARWLMWGFVGENSWISRSIVGAVIGSLVLGGLPALWNWTKEKEKQGDAKPDVTMRLIYPQRPALVLENMSDVTAKQIKYSLAVSFQ